MNSRLDPVQAAVLDVKLEHLDAWNARRAAMADRYLSDLAGIEELTLPSVRSGSTPTWHLFVLRLEGLDRLRAWLDSAGIGTCTTRCRAIVRTATSDINCHDSNCPSERVFDVPQPPLDLHMDDEAQTRVISSVLSYFGRPRHDLESRRLQSPRTARCP